MAVGDLAFKALTAGLGVATLYLAGTFSVNVYRGLSWHSEQSRELDATISVKLWDSAWVSMELDKELRKIHRIAMEAREGEK